MFYKRDILSQLENELVTKETTVITGMRQVGKTTLLIHLFDLVQSANKVLLDLENPLHRKIFEVAKEQISLVGKVDMPNIAEYLNVNISTAESHVKKMGLELALLIKKWQDERDKLTARKETMTDSLIV